MFLSPLSGLSPTAKGGPFTLPQPTTPARATGRIPTDATASPIPPTTTPTPSLSNSCYPYQRSAFLFFTTSTSTLTETMDTTLSALHFYAPILENSHPTIPLSEQLRVLRVNIILYLKVLDGIQRSILRQSLEEEKRELREKHEWYARTYRALRVNEREIQKAMIGIAQKETVSS